MDPKADRMVRARRVLQEATARLPEWRHRPPFPAAAGGLLPLHVSVDIQCCPCSGFWPF